MCHLLKQSKGKGIGDIPSVSSLISYLSSSGTLNKVSIYSRNGHGRDCHMRQGLCGSILFALTGNTNLVHLEVRAPLAAYALVHFLTNAPPSLRTFTLDTFHSAFSELSKEEQLEIAWSLGAIQNLTRLELTHIFDFGPDKDIVLHHYLDVILNEAALHASLKVIALCWDRSWGRNQPTDVIPTAPYHLFQSPCVSIEHVSLQKFKFNQNTWTTLKCALQIGKLKIFSLLQCCFDESATEALVATLREPARDTGDEIVQELVLELPTDVEPFESETASSVIFSMLTATSRFQHKLCIRGLRPYHGKYNFAFFISFHRWEDIQIPVLYIDFMSTCDFDALAKVLPMYTKLMGLVVNCVDHRPKGSWILTQGFRQNASLVYVDMKGSDGVSPLLNVSDLCKLEAYCLRNKHAPMLLKTSKTSVHLIPLLFAAVQQSPKQAINSILMGLLHSSGRDCGQVHSSAKRQYL
jgi:hypothetical protein